jgi:hypothetical protein
MIRRSSTATSATERPGRSKLRDFLFNIGRVMLVGVLFLLFYWLALDMVHHRFFRGQRSQPNGALGQ